MQEYEESCAPRGEDRGHEHGAAPLQQQLQQGQRQFLANLAPENLFKIGKREISHTGNYYLCVKIKPFSINVFARNVARKIILSSKFLLTVCPRSLSPIYKITYFLVTQYYVRPNEEDASHQLQISGLQPDPWDHLRRF